MTKIVANAGPLAKALALAASLDPGERPSAALQAVNVTAGDGAAALTRIVSDHQITLKVPATIVRPGSLAMPSGQLPKLAAGFPAAAEITIEDDGNAARIRAGRGHYKLPVTPAGGLPAELAVATKATAVELGRADALALFAPAFCAATHDDARLYLHGVHIHDDAAGLTAVATDGYALSRRVLPGIAGWGSAITVPSAGVKIINKLIANKSVERVTLRHTKTLLAVETPAAVFVSKLIDATYPDYARTISKPSGNSAVVLRAGVLQVLERLTAVGGRLVRLSWTEGELALHLTTADNAEALDAKVAGTGSVVLAIDRLMALLAGLTGKSVELDSTDAATPPRLTDSDDSGILALLAPTSGEPR
jgi:DNA polymerase-3 subunit beta